jgi:ABC-type glycerol-3-phosphate transport system substrate-binding protein
MKPHAITIYCVLAILACMSVEAREQKLVIWSHWGGEVVKVNFMNAVAAEFQKASGIKVEIVWVNKIELMEKLVFALDTPEPDISYIDGGFFNPRIGRSLVDLSDLSFTGQIDRSWSLGSIRENNNIFLPIEGISDAIYYNKPLFEQTNIILPQDRLTTSQEFLDIIRKLRTANITPIGEGTADRTGKVGVPIMNTIFRYAGPEKVEQLTKGNLNFADPDVVAALKFWKQVIDAQGYDVPKILQLTMEQGIFEVTDGKAAICFSGTWIYGKYAKTARDHGQIGVLDWFMVENGKGNRYYNVVWVSGFGVNRHSAHLAEAQQFLQYLMTPAAASLWLKYVQTPYPVMADEISPDSLYGMLARQRKGQQPAPQSLTYHGFQSKVTQELWEDETRRFVMGEHTVEQFIERMNSRLE